MRYPWRMVSGAPLVLLMVLVSASATSHAQQAGQARQAGLAKRSAAEVAAARAVVAIYDSLEAAGRRHDRAAVARLYAPEFLWVHARGMVVTRAEQIESQLERDWSLGGIPPQPIDSVQVVGNVAIMRNRREGLYMTDVMTRQSGHWQLSLTQETKLSPAVGGIPVDATTLDVYIGRYMYDTTFAPLGNRPPGTYVTVTRSADTLFVARSWGMGGGVPVAFFAIGQDTFRNGAGAQIHIERDAAGRVVRQVYTPPPGSAETPRAYRKTPN